MSLSVLDHPLAHHLLADLRDRTTPPALFRRQARILSELLIVEATRSLDTMDVEVETPLERTSCRRLAEGLAVVPILRAGLSMLEPALEIFPDVAVGYIGLERSHDTAIASSYYCKLPDLTGRCVIVVDPMLATGGSASQAIGLVKGHGGKKIVMASVVAAPEGIQRLTSDHPDVMIVTASVDRELNDRKYILPGLGDYGDRLFGT